MKGQIEKRGNEAYRLRWFDGRREGRRVYHSETIHGTKKQAERRLREILGLSRTLVTSCGMGVRQSFLVTLTAAGR